MNQRLTVYRRFAAVRTDAELDRLMDEVRDRYGPAGLGPEPGRICRHPAHGRPRSGSNRSTAKAQLVVLKFRPEAKLDPQWLFRVVQERGDVTLVPPATLKLDLRGARRPGAGPGAAGPPKGRGEGKWSKGPIRSRRSWWTARATAGEVAGGFTRDEILRPAKEDPRAGGASSPGSRVCCAS